MVRDIANDRPSSAPSDRGWALGPDDDGRYEATHKVCLVLNSASIPKVNGVPKFRWRHGGSFPACRRSPAARAPRRATSCTARTSTETRPSRRQQRLDPTRCRRTRAGQRDHPLCASPTRTHARRGVDARRINERRGSTRCAARRKAGGSSRDGRHRRSAQPRLHPRRARSRADRDDPLARPSRTGKLVERVTLYNPGGGRTSSRSTLRPIPNPRSCSRPGHGAEPAIRPGSRVGRREVIRGARPFARLAGKAPSSPARHGHRTLARCASPARAHASYGDRQVAEAESLQGEIERGGGTAPSSRGTSPRADAERAVDVCVERHAIDILFCNVGITLPKQLHDSTDDEIAAAAGEPARHRVRSAPCHSHARPAVGERRSLRRARQPPGDRFPVYRAPRVQRHAARARLCHRASG